MAIRYNSEWSKSYKCEPQDNIISHRYSKSKPFIPSYERMNCPVSMNLLLGWEYARIWEREHNAYLQRRIESEKVRKVKRAPYKKPQKKPAKTDRFKKMQIKKSDSMRKPRKFQNKSMAYGSKQSGGAAGGETLNYGYGDIVGGNLNLPDDSPANEITAEDNTIEEQTTRADVKLMQNEIARQYPKTYLDPNQYLGGVPIGASDVQDVCQPVAC